jgi:hypothetical protein
MRKFITCCLLLSLISLTAQNRLFERTGPGIGRTVVLDKGGGESYWIVEQRYNFDSTHIHLLSADIDLQLNHLGAFRAAAPLGWMNDAAIADNDLIIGGASLGFTTIPYVLRMDNTGNIPWAYYFSNFTSGNTQILNTETYGSKLDLFTWSDNTRFHYYMINGYSDGNFPTALKVNSPEDTEIRVDEVAKTSNDREYIVICQADTNSTFSKFLYIMHIDTTGVLSAMMHDHDTSMDFETESGYGLFPSSDGNWIYTATFNDAGTGLKNRLVKMQSDGSVIWSKEYWLDGEKLNLGSAIETTDSGLLFAAFLGNAYYYIRTDSNAEILWSKEYVQENSSVNPIGNFFKNDLGQLYSLNAQAITEIDEEANVCDMQPHTGITVSDAPFNTLVVSASSETINPEAVDFPHYSRSGEYSNLLDCLSLSIEESQSPPFNLFPNPTSDFLYIDAERVQAVEVWSMIGEMLLSGRQAKIDMRSLAPGIYLVAVQIDERWIMQEVILQ